jgi:hypothetical protein
MTSTGPRIAAAAAARMPFQGATPIAGWPRRPDPLAYKMLQAGSGPRGKVILDVSAP